MRANDDEEDEAKKEMAVRCSVCANAVQRKNKGDPFMCKGYDKEASQKVCVAVMESMMWWVENVVYWTNFGCEMKTDDPNNPTTWVNPCPPNAVCGWLENFQRTPEEDEKTFCPEDPKYIKPSGA